MPNSVAGDGGDVKGVLRALKLAGFSAKADAVRALARLLAREHDPDASLGAVLDCVKDKLARGDITSSVLSVDTVSAVVAELSKEDGELDNEATQYLDAFASPRLAYNSLRRTLYLEPATPGKRRMHAAAEAKPQMFRDRFVMVRQRVERSALFCPPVIASSRRTHLQLTPLDALLGAHGSKVMLGMLTQPQEGRYYLEDLSTQVRLDLSATAQTCGLFTENSIVVVEGEMVDGVLRASLIGMPPPEAREETLAAAGYADLFGTGIAPQQAARLAELGKNATDAMFVILSDVHLDSPAVLERLRKLFGAFAELEPPPLFVLTGNFSSAAVGQTPEGAGEMVAHFATLAALISEWKPLAESARFVFVPGPNDPGAGSVLPRPPLPELFTRALRERVRHATFASNPCRLRFYSQELVFFREDLLRKMQRHCVLPPRAPGDASAVSGVSETELHVPDALEGEEEAAAMVDDLEIAEGTQETSAGAEGGGNSESSNAGTQRARAMDATEHLAKTVFDQGHLCPLPLAARPICWQLDHALSLYPLPHVAVLADAADQYQWRYSGAVALNPGSFQHDGAFVVYRPATRETEFSRID